MIRTIGVTQVKYCHRININSVKIQFIPYAFYLNQLHAEDASKMTCKSHEQRPARARILLSRLEAGTLLNLVFSDKKKFDVQHHVNPQNDCVWSRDGKVGPLKSHLEPRGGVSDGLGSPYRIWKKSFGFRRTRRQTEPRGLPK